MNVISVMENVLKTDFKSMEVNAINALFAEKDNKKNTITMLVKQAQIKTSLFLPKKAWV